MDSQGPDRSALIGILLMSLLLGVWMIYSSPSAEEVARQQATADSLAAVDDGDDASAADVEAPADEDALVAPADSAFVTGGPARPVTVVTDRLVATFSTAGGTLTSVRLVGYDRAGTDQPVELVTDARGALALGVTPERGAFLDSRTLTFRPVVGGQPFEGDTLRVDGDAVDLTFETSAPGVASQPGALRLVYRFAPDSYDVDLRVEAAGTDLLGSGYELMWDGALPLAEDRPETETMQAGAYLRMGGETDKIHLTEAGRAEPISRTGTVDWVAVKTKFFIAAIIPAEGTPTEGAELTGEQTGAAGEAGFAQDFVARLTSGDLDAGDAHAYTLYLGPLELRRLAAYGLYDTVDFGFGQVITRPIARYVIAPTLALLTGLLPNYGLAIILFGLLVKLVLWPLTSASFRSAAKMRELQPQMQLIKEQHADDPQKQQEAMMRMYREAGVNPLGGCLPMLLQYPILIALWQFFQSTLVLRGQPFLWARDLSAPDAILNLPFNIPFYGDFVAGFTLLMGVSMLVSMKLSMGGSASVTGQQKVLLYVMPAVFFLFFNRLPSGLSLYYLSFNIFSIVQQRMINQQVHRQHELGQTPEIDRAAAMVTKRNGQAKRGGKGGFTSQVVSGAKRGRKK